MKEKMEKKMERGRGHVGLAVRIGSELGVSSSVPHLTETLQKRVGKTLTTVVPRYHTIRDV